MRKYSLPASFLLLSLAGLPAEAQIHPALERGIVPEKLYNFGEIDAVNLFNGSLSIPKIAIGHSYSINGGLTYSLNLAYSSNVWSFDQRQNPDPGPPNFFTRAFLRASQNAGAGFDLSIGGRLLTGVDDVAVSGLVFVAPDGSEHKFYATLHIGDAANSGACYTRDGSYLRVLLANCLVTGQGNVADVEFPDGRIHHFSRTSSTAPYLLDYIRDRFGNQVTINKSALQWSISDGFRSHSVYFQTRSSGMTVVDRVEVVEFSGTTTWDFDYWDGQIERNGKDSDPQTSVNVNVSLLKSITVTDGATPPKTVLTWTFLEADGLTAAYNTTGFATGTLRRLTLPTRGTIEWTYLNYQFAVPTGENYLHLEQAAGVATRRVLDASGACYGGGSGCTWTYSTTRTGAPLYERQMIVRTPLGDETVSYFFENPVRDATTWTGWDYGLPIKKSATDGSGRFLSQEVYAGTVPGGGIRRSIYVQYEHDKLSANELSGYGWYDTNRRVASSRTVFNDDGSRVADNTSSEFDGLGHYRTVTTAGTFDAGNVRTEKSDFNVVPGCYRVNATNNVTTDCGQSFVMPSAGIPWVLDRFASKRIDEGGAIEYETFCFDTANGFLKRKRIYASGTNPGASDVVVVYTPDATGNVDLEQFFGGDLQIVSTGTDLCSLGLPAASISIDYSYQYGSLKSAQHVGAGFFDADFDIDDKTGLVKTRRDAAGVTTSYEYDALGRLVWEKPLQDAWTSYGYLRAVGTGNASVNIRRYPNGTASGQLTDESVEFDHLGRVWREKRRTPSGVWAKRTSFYNALGWRTHLSEWQQDGQSHTAYNQYLLYDPFGRPGVIEPPDGAAHRVLLNYAGVRTLTRTTKIATGASGIENSSTTTEIYDRQGRLYQIKEPSGAAGAVVTTTYGYDAAGRLISTSTPSGSTQTRSFTYDPRGFLTRECHPEKGVSGNGCVNYSLYDARGRAGRKIDGTSDLRFFYDGAERLTQVNDTPSGFPIKVFTYGTGTGAADRSRGKVKTAARYNRILALNATVLITETYTYGGDQGRVSQRDTQNNVNGTNTELFRQTFAWNDLGDLASQTYPDCAAYCTPSTPRSQSYSYTDGRLTSVPGFLSSITYNLSGLVNIINRTNGTWDRWTADTTFTGRPLNIEGFTNNWNPVPFGLWTTGTFQYDGAGNIKKMGSAAFTYDAVSRLVAATVYPGSYGDGTAQTQSYAYDAFGNQTSRTTNGATVNSPVAAASNHLTGASYDGAGNHTSWNGATYEYDPMSMLMRMTNGAEDWVYIYTADDERFWSYRVGLNGSIWTLRGLDGKVLRNYNAHINWSNFTDYVYREGTLAAAVANGVVTHVHPDHLGTPRLVSSASGAANQVSFHAYYPFGEEINFSGASYADRLRFTGHERDLANASSPADDLDYMHARHYGPLSGRFLSADRAGGKPAVPQSWNRYAYARDNPVRFLDPDGNEVVDLYVRHFIAAPSIYSPLGRMQGDNRSFSLRATASFRTVNHIRIETDVAKSASGLVSQSASTGDTLNRTFGLEGRATGSSMVAIVQRNTNGSVSVFTFQNEAIPKSATFGLDFSSFGLGIRSVTATTISADASLISGVGERSAFPSMEINAEVAGQTFSLFRGSETSTGLGLLGTENFSFQCTGATSSPECTQRTAGGK